MAVKTETESQHVTNTNHCRMKCCKTGATSSVHTRPRRPIVIAVTTSNLATVNGIKHEHCYATYRCEISVSQYCWIPQSHRLKFNILICQIHVHFVHNCLSQSQHKIPLADEQFFNCVVLFVGWEKSKIKSADLWIQTNVFIGQQSQPAEMACLYSALISHDYCDSYYFKQTVLSLFVCLLGV